MSDVLLRQPIRAHLQELRRRMLWCLMALLTGATVGYVIKDQLLQALVQPLGKTLYYMSPGGGLSLVIQLCLCFGLIVTTPFVMFHVTRFIAPVLPGYSVRSLTGILVASCLLIAVGVAFAYSVGLPAALSFLSEFSNDRIQALISADTYSRFVAIYLAGFAMIFQLPLVLIIASRFVPIRTRTLLATTK
ncbi:MAG: twin-arginine translocase subunit TatC [Thermomicrobiales bacterium]